ncbi:MAG: hypothetical protein ACFFFB_07075 [Candidatus Heimdallarchaeota archaeon]
MSVIYHRQKKKKRKYPRNRVSRKVLHRKKIKKRILKAREWKLNYPDLFELSDKYPYIVKKKEK